MKAVFILCALVVAVSARPDEKYTTKYDSIDIDEILSSKRLFEAYCKCMLEQGPCTPEGKELRSNLEDGLKTKCSKCSPKQTEGARKIISYMIKNEPTCWKALCDKYDPEGKYAKQYEEELKTVS